MKILWNRKYNTIAVYVCATAFIIITAICLFVNFSAVRAALDRAVAVLAPVLWGFSFAYLLFPAYRFFRDRAFEFIGDTGRRRRVRKALALVTTYLCALLLLALFILVVVPQIAGSYKDLQSRVGGYFVSLQEWLERQAANSDLFAEQYQKLLEFVDIGKLSERLHELVTGSFDVVVSGTSYVFGVLGGVVTQIKNILLGLIISVYMILWKEKLAAQTKKLLHALLERKAVDRVLDLFRTADRTFGGFIVGKLIDSLIIGMMTFIVLGIFDMPYYPLVSVMVGVTNVIPFFGPFIGAIPGAFIIFVADPVKALWFIVIIIIIQQIDGNIIGPRILGDTTGLSALWVIISIIVMSGLFGVLGMFIGVPVFAVLYSLIKEAAETRLRKRGLPVSTHAYYTGEPDGVRPVKVKRRNEDGSAGFNTSNAANDDVSGSAGDTVSGDASGGTADGANGKVSGSAENDTNSGVEDDKSCAVHGGASGKASGFAPGNPSGNTTGGSPNVNSSDATDDAPRSESGRKASEAAGGGKLKNTSGNAPVDATGNRADIQRPDRRGAKGGDGQ